MPKKQKESKYSIPFIKPDCAIYLKLIVTSKIIFLVDFFINAASSFSKCWPLPCHLHKDFFFCSFNCCCDILLHFFFFFASSVEAGLLQILRCLNTPRFQEGNSFHRKNSFLVLVTVSFDQFSSVQFSHSAVSNYLQPHESQHTRPPCPSPTPGVHSNSRPSSW